MRESSGPDDLALSGDYLNSDDKVLMHQKLGSIWHGLAVAHEGVGYCQGGNIFLCTTGMPLNKAP